MSQTAPEPSPLPKAHPLWPLIASAPPLSLSVIPAHDSHPLEKKAWHEALVAAGVLHLALAGNSGSFDEFDAVVGFACGTEAGLRLAQSACIARQSGPAVWRSFRVSLWLDGFESTFFKWLPLVRTPEEPEPLRAQLRRIHDSETQDHELADYLAAQLPPIRNATDLREIALSFAKEQKAFEARGKAREPQGGKTLAAIRNLWISHALWCLNVPRIGLLLWGRNADLDKAIYNKISELGLTKTRRPEHHAMIDRGRKAGGFPEI